MVVWVVQKQFHFGEAIWEMDVKKLVFWFTGAMKMFELEKKLFGVKLG